MYGFHQESRLVESSHTVRSGVRRETLKVDFDEPFWSQGHAIASLCLTKVTPNTPPDSQDHAKGQPRVVSGKLFAGCNKSAGTGSWWKVPMGGSAVFRSPFWIAKEPSRWEGGSNASFCFNECSQKEGYSVVAMFLKDPKVRCGRDSHCLYRTSILWSGRLRILYIPIYIFIYIYIYIKIYLLRIGY